MSVSIKLNKHCNKIGIDDMLRESLSSKCCFISAKADDWAILEDNLYINDNIYTNDYKNSVEMVCKVRYWAQWESLYFIIGSNCKVYALRDSNEKQMKEMKKYNFV